MPEVTDKKELTCFHCGDHCADDSVRIDDKVFCCNGCKTVYEILQEKNACQYYALEDHPGTRPDDVVIKEKYEFLDDEEFQETLVDFRDGSIKKLTFKIPDMHCSSCIWLLENLSRFNKGIISSRVNFLNKQLSLTLKDDVKISEIAALLASLGYEPLVSPEDMKKQEIEETNKKLYYKLGIAGFSFGNIMLLSFPEYLSADFAASDLRGFFGWAIFILSLPVILYASSDYLISAWKGLKSKIINIDVPLSLGIITLYVRSVYEIFFNAGAGYMDSFTGLIFFLLLGKLFQNKTYELFNFERSFKSYFPISVTTRKNGVDKNVPLSKLKVGDRIVVRNEEVIPVDAFLLKGEGNIDYSFVSGESTPVQRVLGETIYAGGRQIGSSIEAEAAKEVSQSYLTRLWNEYLSAKYPTNKLTQISNTVSKYFTIAVLMIAGAALLYWLPYSLVTAITAFTSVLIVACPCALAISTPFTLGNSLRIFGRNDFYLKNTDIIEQMSKIKAVVFDKTGTITETGRSGVTYSGDDLTEYEKSIIKSAVINSTHPLSRLISKYLTEYDEIEPDVFEEKTGKGLTARFGHDHILIGSKSFILGSIESSLRETEYEEITRAAQSKVYISINGEQKGLFKFRNYYRSGIREMIRKLNEKYQVYLLSGDNDNEKENLLEFFEEKSLYFNQSPLDKKDFINELQARGIRTMMIGDGLNDAGALKQSDIGISVTDDIFNFTPSSDGIIKASMLGFLNKFLDFAESNLKIIKYSFAMSFIYNVAGLAFAVQGLLSPLIAAILMPLSSISVVIFTTAGTALSAKRKKLWR